MVGRAGAGARRGRDAGRRGSRAKRGKGVPASGVGRVSGQAGKGEKPGRPALASPAGGPLECVGGEQGRAD